MRNQWSTATVARTVVIAAYLVVLVVAGRPGRTAVAVGALLLVVWLAPWARSRAERPTGVVAS